MARQEELTLKRVIIGTINLVIIVSCFKYIFFSSPSVPKITKTHHVTIEKIVTRLDHCKNGDYMISINPSAGNWKEALAEAKWCSKQLPNDKYLILDVNKYSKKLANYNKKQAKLNKQKLAIMKKWREE